MSERIDVPGGWIYFGHPLPCPVLVSDPFCWTLSDQTAGKIFAALAELKQEIRTMSTTLSEQITQATAELQADVAALTTGITALETELATALAGVAAGDTVTQAQVDALTAVHTSLAALATSIPAAPVATTPAA